MGNKISVLFLLVVSCAFIPSNTKAGTVFLGPTPYLSAADSPFPVDGSDPNFFLEDFEDGMLNTPGIEIEGLDSPPFSGIVGPGLSTDSVDGDDGVIDGSGSGGHAIRRRMGPNFDPHPTFLTRFVIRFSRDELGFLPNAFGFVWTDGPQLSRVNIGAWNEDLNPIDGTLYTGLGDDSDFGGTSEDRFVGLRANENIALVHVNITFIDPKDETPRDFVTFAEIDHVQFGFIVPEPSSFVLLLVASMAWQTGRRHHDRRSLD